MWQQNQGFQDTNSWSDFPDYNNPPSFQQGSDSMRILEYVQKELKTRDDRIMQLEKRVSELSIKLIEAQGQKKSENPIREKIEDCKRAGKCTISVTGKDHFPQVYYRCYSCRVGYENTKNMGICESCIKTCHQGHMTQIHPESGSAFFCDCGDGNKGCKCV